MAGITAFLGCSRGLGQAVCLEWSRRGLGGESLLVSRNSQLLESLSKQLTHPSMHLSIDFSQEKAIEELLPVLKELKPSRVFYFAGGGPFGLYHDKNWKDHHWALQVSLLAPMQLVHHILRDEDLSSVKQVILVGSQIADRKPDPMASSYTTAKHGLYGFVTTLTEEEVPLDLRLFRPGYMDTDLLPPKAKPRLQPGKLQDPDSVAQSFVTWALEPSGAPLFDA